MILNQTKTSSDKAQSAAAAATDKKKKADVAFADARPASEELAKAQQQAGKEEAIAISEAKAAKDAYNKLLALAKKQQGSVTAAQNAVKGIGHSQSQSRPAGKGSRLQKRPIPDQRNQENAFKQLTTKVAQLDAKLKRCPWWYGRSQLNSGSEEQSSFRNQRQA
ncbi:hypothetical protein GQR58_030533 [Nymphon striatum]|nr:hypothetical protein GQR58_030533 [Nymphon striatum]